jgi:hypothetical protein
MDQELGIIKGMYEYNVTATAELIYNRKFIKRWRL